MSEVQTKLSAARTRLILEKPFIGTLVMHLGLVEADPGWCATTATDARAFYYNPAYVAGLSLSQAQFVLAHEALHCALGHIGRRQHRVKRRWDVACDHAVNLLLHGENLKPPPGALLNSEYAGLSAEEIYPLIADDTTERPMDKHLFEGGREDEPPPEARPDSEHPEPLGEDAGGAKGRDPQSLGRESQGRDLQDTDFQGTARPDPSLQDPDFERDLQEAGFQAPDFHDFGPNAQDQDSSGRSRPQAREPKDRSPLSRDSWRQESRHQESRRQESRVPEGAQDPTPGGHDAPAPSSPPEPGPAERDALTRQWQGRLAAAAQQARLNGKLGESWARLVDDLIQPSLSWRALLARYLVSAARDDFSFQRPSRREGDAILPWLYSREIRMVVALDTSGSIGETEMREFVAEVESLKGQIRARVSLLACDERLAPGAPWEFESWQALALPASLEGGGGTSFVPVFDWVGQQGWQPDVLVYFTDAEGEFPPRPPAYPVVWLVKGKAPVLWGQRVQLN